MEQTVQVLGTNGSGVLSFVSTTSSIAGASDTDISSASSGQILVHDGSDFLIMFQYQEMQH